MTQLTDDCFAFGGALQTLDEALARIQTSVKPLAGTDSMSLFDAVGHVAARTYTSTQQVPPHNNSAVDGYAVRHSALNTDKETLLSVSGRIAAGDSAIGLAETGDALRIFTGALIPAGFDTIFMQEDVHVQDDGHIKLPMGLKLGSNLRLAGEDVQLDQVLVSKGQVLRPQDLALLAGQGLSEVEVTRQLNVGVLSTGSELGVGALDTGQVFDTNQTMLVSALKHMGIHAKGLGIVPDELAATEKFLTNCAPKFDLIITTGGVSTGEEDHVKTAVENVGRLDFWRVALKPGRPVALGDIGACVFVGLPGNPVAAMVTFISVVQPLIHQLQGRVHIFHKPVKAMLMNATKKKTGRREFLRVSETDISDDGVLQVVQHPSKGAGVLTSLTGSDGLLILPDELKQVSANSGPYDYLRFSDVLGGLM